jgi:hypothetical protein
VRKGLLAVVFAAALGVVVGCNFFGEPRPEGFDGWFHLDRTDRATNIRFANPQIFQIRDFGCADQSAADQEWAIGTSDTLVAVQWPGSPTFSRNGDQGGLDAVPPLFQDAGSEHWISGARCMQCPLGDAGVSVACDFPDAGP